MLLVLVKAMLRRGRAFLTVHGLFLEDNNCVNYLPPSHSFISHHRQITNQAGLHWEGDDQSARARHGGGGGAAGAGGGEGGGEGGEIHDGVRAVSGAVRSV